LTDVPVFPFVPPFCHWAGLLQPLVTEWFAIRIKPFFIAASVLVKHERKNPD
jgi:hypothetical protein